MRHSVLFFYEFRWLLLQNGLLQAINKTACFLFLGLFIACGAKEDYVWKSMEVTVSAYNSVSYQTVNHPNLAAWGDTLVPGEKSIAVSRDLIAKGLRHMTKVKIEGLPGIYIVKDKMNRKWGNRIDIYMGKDIKKAKEWGLKKRTIQYAVASEVNTVK